MKITAHRGYSGKYPENTMEAFEKAVLSGCDEIELDVQMTKDGTAVIIHDETTDRTTDGHGFVRDYTYNEIRRLSAGNGQQIPAFEEYAALAADAGIITNIELKTSIYYYEGIEENVWNMIRKYRLENKVLFSSFNPLSLIKIKTLDKTVPCGLLTDEDLGNAGACCHMSGLEFYHPNIAKLKADTVKSCRQNGIEINVWTVNDRKDFEKAYAFGCRSVITNFPENCLEWRNEIKNL